MIHRPILFICMLFAALPGVTQNRFTDTSASCVAYWKEGDIKNLQVNRLSRMLENGKETEFSISSYGATVTVVDSTDKGYIVDWSYKPEKKPAKPSAQNQLDDVIRRLRVVYAIHNDGSFDSLMNYDDLKKIVVGSFAEIADSNANNPEFKNGMQKIEALFQDKESLEQVVLREIFLYHSPYGISYSSVHPTQLPGQLPNFFGGPALPAILTLALTKIDSTKDIATFTVTNQIDQGKLALMRAAMDKNVRANPRQPVPKNQLPKELQITDKTVYEMILSTGWLKRVYFTREVKTPAFDKVEACEIKITE